MVKVTREASRTGPLRRLNTPVGIEVEENERHRPISLTLRGRRIKIVSIDDLWEIDEEWWREKPIARRYYQVTTGDGRRIIIFRDLMEGGWCCQRA